MEASISYGSAYTFSSINLQDTPTHFEVDMALEKLGKVVANFAVSENNILLFSTDYSEYEYKGQSLELHLFDITEDPLTTSYFLSEIEKIIGANKGYIDTEAMVNCILGNNQLALPLEYGLYSNEYWPTLAENVHVKNYMDVCNINSFSFKNSIKTRNEFTKKAEIIYEHIQFHSNFEDKLKTIKNGTFTDYLSEFSHALNVLNQAYFHISIDENQNEADLGVITNLSAEALLKGRRLACTRQAKQKPHFHFKDLNNPTKTTNELGKSVITYPMENLNCEYHLKLNFNDQDIKLQDDYNRAYFALKHCNKVGRKLIKLAYIGEHWPPQKDGKKRRK